MGRKTAAYKARVPLTDEHKHHIARSLEKRKFDDRTLLDSRPMPQEIQADIDYANSLYRQFEPTIQRVHELRNNPDEKTTAKVEKLYKQVRKRIAPQLLLVLITIDRKGRALPPQSLTPEVIGLINTATKELSKYYFYEPVFSLYKVLHDRKRLYLPTGVEIAKTFALRFLIVAMEHATVRLGCTQKVLAALGYEPEDQELREMILDRKYSAVRQKLIVAQREWLAIQEHWNVLHAERDDAEKAVLDRVVSGPQLERQLKSIADAISIIEAQRGTANLTL